MPEDIIAPVPELPLLLAPGVVPALPPPIIELAAEPSLGVASPEPMPLAEETVPATGAGLDEAGVASAPGGGGADWSPPDVIGGADEADVSEAPAFPADMGGVAEDASVAAGASRPC